MKCIKLAILGLSVSAVSVCSTVWADSINTMQQLQAETGQLNQQARSDMQQWQQNDAMATPRAAQPAPDSREAWQQAGERQPINPQQMRDNRQGWQNVGDTPRGNAPGARPNTNRQQWQQAGSGAGPQPRQQRQQRPPRPPRGTRTMPNMFPQPQQ